MAELKTRKNDASVSRFIAAVENPARRKDCQELVDLMTGITGSQARMWGSSIVGFGEYHYVYESGREGDWFACGFSPRKTALTLYIMSGFREHDALMKKLGKYKTGKSCLYLKSLDDIDRDVLRQLVARSVEYIRQKYAPT